VLDPLIGTILSIGFGLMLLMASVHKLSEFGRFRAVLADYRVMPGFIVPLVAAILPLVEIGLGLAWLFADNIAVPAGATVALLVVYTGSIATNLLRGRVHISCGCGFGKSTGADDALSWGLVLRNVVLLGAASAATLPVEQRTVGLLDYVTLVTALLAAILLFAAGNQLIRNGAAIHSWRSRVTRDD
jgi:hypothetical protein